MQLFNHKRNRLETLYLLLDKQIPIFILWVSMGSKRDAGSGFFSKRETGLSKKMHGKTGK